jgi:hypothetical protein
MENPQLSSISENTSQKIFFMTDKINEIVNDSDSVVVLVSKVNSPFSGSGSTSSSSEEEEVGQNLAEARREHAGPLLNAQTQILS